MLMDREILNTAEFQKELGDKFIFYMADFPRKIELDAATKAKNAELEKTFGVQGYPTVVIADADLKPIVSLNYRSGGPASFISDVKKAIKSPSTS